MKPPPETVEEADTADLISVKVIEEGHCSINVKDVIHSKVNKCFSFVFCADRTCTEHGVARGKALQSSFT